MIDRIFKTDPDADSYDFNLGNHPDKCGFDRVADCDEPGMSYEFNTYLVLKDKETGAFYGAGSSGCSCPTPFEEYTRLSELTALRDLDHLEEELLAQFANVLKLPDPKDEYDSYKHQRGPLKDDIATCLVEAKKAGLA